MKSYVAYIDPLSLMVVAHAPHEQSSIAPHDQSSNFSVKINYS